MRNAADDRFHIYMHIDSQTIPSGDIKKILCMHNFLRTKYIKNRKLIFFYVKFEMSQ